MCVTWLITSLCKHKYQFTPAWPYTTHVFNQVYWTASIWYTMSWKITLHERLKGSPLRWCITTGCCKQTFCAATSPKTHFAVSASDNMHKFSSLESPWTLWLELTFGIQFLIQKLLYQVKQNSIYSRKEAIKFTFYCTFKFPPNNYSTDAVMIRELPQKINIIIVL